MIRLTSAGDGTPVIVNPARVFTVRESAAGTAILSAGGDAVYVKQALGEVEKRIGAALASPASGQAPAADAAPAASGEADAAADTAPKGGRPRGRAKKA